MIVVVDFDFTLAIGNTPNIAERQPNYLLIDRLHKLRETTECTIKVVTARGGADNKTLEQKHEQYLKPITDWLMQHDVPYDTISFNKEYGHLYIDDLGLKPFEPIVAGVGDFTGNKIVMTADAVYKFAPTAAQEAAWYAEAEGIVPTPYVMSFNKEYIALQRIYPNGMVRVDDAIEQLREMASHINKNHNFNSYQQHINNSTSRLVGLLSGTAQLIASNLPEQPPTFFHGDYSVLNLLPTEEGLYCIDPLYRGIFGNYMTDAGKLAFSYIAYYRDFHSAAQLAGAFGNDVYKFAVAEGIRVAKNKPEYTDIVNNIALVCTK